MKLKAIFPFRLTITKQHAVSLLGLLHPLTVTDE